MICGLGREDTPCYHDVSARAWTQTQRDRGRNLKHFQNTSASRILTQTSETTNKDCQREQPNVQGRVTTHGQQEGDRDESQEVQGARRERNKTRT